MRFDDRVTGNLDHYAKQAKILHFEIDPAEVNKNVEVDIAVLGDIKKTLPELIKIVKNKSHDKWVNKFKSFYDIEFNKVINNDLFPTKEML
jgi:acetolactate synthase-1/2/3 large subunit